jgi:hypothetical protein
MTDPQTITKLLRASSIDLDKLAQAFDSSRHQNRLNAIRTLSKDDQRRLYQAADGRPAPLERFVPADVDPMQEVIHHGQNTLPAFRSFQKRFCRPPTNTQDRPSSDNNIDTLWGYNEQTFQLLTGPGYFTAHECDDTGETLIDYRRLPDDRLPHWPDIVSNRSRLGRFVYAGTIDRMREVSDHVTIGRAYDGDDAMDNWFILVREPNC